MTRGGKVLFSFIALVLGTFLFTVFVHYQFVYSLNIRFIKPEEYPLIGNYMPFYFYWGSVIGMAILALVILWIILRPTEVTSIKLSEDKGKLEIKKSAIVGLIESVDAYIKEFIGLDTAIKTEVVFKNTARSNTNKTRKKRVV